MRNYLRTLAAIGVALGIAASVLTLAQETGTQKPDEYLLLGSPNRGAGEPVVFVNPKDPNNIIVVAMATLNRLPSGETPAARGGRGGGSEGAPGRGPRGPELRIKELSTPDGSRTDIAVTQDGGKTWSFGEDNFRKTLKKNRCSDSFAGPGPDGSLYMGCIAYLNPGGADYESGNTPGGEARVYHGGSAIARSTDKGKTWSKPVWVHPALSPSLYAPTVKPVFEQASPWDRPLFAADASTGAIYVSGMGSAYTVDPATVERPKIDPSLPGKGYTGYPPASVTRFRNFLRASHDQGRTWGVIYPLDSDEYPGGLGSFAAGHGTLAVTYIARSVPTTVVAQCPCTIFGTSRDDGKTFEYRVVPPLAEPPRGGGIGGGTMLSADASKDGRFAIARMTGTAIQVSFTDDGGKTWAQPVVAAQAPPQGTFMHQAMKFSPKGDLALMWKARYSDGSFDVWSAASRDGGHTFKTVRVSSAVSPPYNRERGNFMAGDDLSSIDADNDYVHIVWGDGRAGFQGTWYGRVPFSAY